MTSSDWTWELRNRAIDQFDALDTATQRRIADKLDDIVTDEWREPNEYVEPLQGVPHGKIRVGDYRLGARANEENRTLESSRSNTAPVPTRLMTTDPTPR